MNNVPDNVSIKSEEQKYSIFLTPAPEDFAYTDYLIRELSARYDAEPFEPHVTVYAGTFRTIEPLESAVRHAIKGVQPFSLPVQGIGFSEEYFKTLFVDFAMSDILRKIYEKIRSGVHEDSGYVLKPHLSLLYHDIPLHDKEALAKTVTLDRSEVHFEQIKIMTPANRIAGWKDAKQWKTLYRSCLDGG